MEQERIERLFARITDIPTLPSSVLTVMRMVEDPNCSAADLARVILTEPAMAAKVLKLANSSYYGFRQKIASIPQAVTLLGFPTLKNALLSASVFDLFRASNIGLDLPSLWKHSIATATASKLFAQRVRFPNVEKAFTVGLLHDVGKIIMARYLNMALLKVLQVAKDENLTIFDAEVKVISLNHAELGAWLLQKWQLPQAITDAVANHHCPSKSQFNFDLAAMAYLANIISHRAKLGNGGDDLPRVADPMVLDYFNLKESALQEVQDSLMFKGLEIDSYASVAAAA
jgi:putative nucleotidyltransferase with HDIG domain